MQVVLNESVKGLGYKGDVVSVKGGYYRNFLLPRRMAELATKEVMKLVEMRREKMMVEKERLLEDVKGVMGKLKGLSLTVRGKASGKGKLYAGITEDDVIGAVLEATKVRLEKEYIKMEHFKEVGEYKVKVEIGKMSEDLTVVVEAE